MKRDVATTFSRGVDHQWKNYTKANFLACDKQGSTAGQVQGLKGSGLQIKTSFAHPGKWDGKVSWVNPKTS